MLYVKLFAIALPIFSLLDFIWLGKVMPEFYKTHLGHLVRKSGDNLDVYWPAGIACYIILLVGLVAFVLPPFAGKPIGWQVFAYGALFGLVGYGIYDLTNWATLRDWPAIVVAVDMAWGAFIYGASAFATAWIARKLGVF